MVLAQGPHGTGTRASWYWHKGIIVLAQGHHGTGTSLYQKWPKKMPGGLTPPAPRGITPPSAEQVSPGPRRREFKFRDTSALTAPVSHLREHQAKNGQKR